MKSMNQSEADCPLTVFCTLFYKFMNISIKSNYFYITFQIAALHKQMKMRKIFSSIKYRMNSNFWNPE